MKRFMISLAASAVTLLAGQALACNVDTDCACGQVCSWAQNPHACVAADGGDPGWCDSNSNCLYEGQSCSGTSCTPAWTANSVCVESTSSSSGSGDSATASAGASSGASGGTFGDAATGNSSSGASNGVGASSGSSASSGVNDAATASSVGSSGATSTGGSSGASSGTGGSTSGNTVTPCTNDNDCVCGELCAWDQGSTHHCVTATTSEPGWCTPGATNTCLYEGQTCDVTSCTPAWTASSVCVEGTTSGSGSSSGSSGATTTSSSSSGSSSASGSSGSSGATTTHGATSGTSTGTTGGTTGETDAGIASGTSSGCSTAPGALTFLATALGLILLRRRSR